jgi:hypothetical protein
MADPANPIGGVLNSLPMDTMFAKPLMAALNAHSAMCLQLGDFIDKIGFIEVGGTPAQGATPAVPGQKAVRMVDWKWTAPAWNEDGTLTQKKDAQGKDIGPADPIPYFAQVPFLSMVPLPALAVEEVSVDFELEVNTSESTSSSTEAEASMSGKAGYLWFSASFSAKVSHKSEQTRKTDTRAKYAVSIKAKRQEPPEALMRMLDMVVDTVTKPKKAS